MHGIEFLWWIGIAVAFTGTLLVSAFKEVRLGHACWIASNALLLTLNLAVGSLPMAVLFALYLGLSFYGVVNWKVDDTTALTQSRKGHR